MTATRTIAVCAAGLLAFACRGGELPASWVRRQPPAQLVVEVLGGFGEPAPTALAGERVELLVDVTSSMKARTELGIRRFEAAREAARRLVRGLPSSASIGLSAMGVRSGECGATRALSGSDTGAPRRQLLRAIDALRPAGESSLARALEFVADRIGEEPGPRRVVAFTDLGRECGGALCRATAALADADVPVDFVVVGDARVPRCLADFSLDAPPAAPSPVDSPVPDYRVETVWVGSSLLVRGRANGSPVALRPTPGMLRIALDPPATLGPIRFTPGTVTHVRVLDFPFLEEPVREWRWDTVPVDPVEEGS